MRFLRNDIGIDLGTSNMLVYVRGKGIILNEPSVVAVNQKTGQVVAVGTEAKNMLGRTPPHIVAVRPIVDGVISDFEVTEEMLHYLLNKAQAISKKFLGPRVVVGVPSSITNVETRAVRDATKNAGASEVHIVEEPMAAAIGMHLPINEPLGSMVIDIGGGTTDIAIISLNGVISSKNIHVAGDKLNSDISAYIRNEFKIVIGEKTSENIKTQITSLLAEKTSFETQARGRDLITGLPREVVVTDSDIREAISHSIERLIEATKEVLEMTPPEILSDIMHRGIYLAGGGALIKGFADILKEEVKMPVYIADDPLTCVVRGTGIILEHLEKYKEVLIANEEDVSNKAH
ncbi:MAG: rod shape-determining protein [Candidatus Zambryskibacteria bacterium RIFCSPLOWO2_01_FULL_35_19]|uniref:Cell shape-determining protein MreB n=1 Tax=Candidatus Zambryskibacteria bacterium RIFCSPLOWO2_01_FULL_35_19 TaxID=1802757 RepID=A0A1G2TY53_9BACT|nr:MAG: rod shape-determining protein [Candidatus Zambryskibacteria bacterium RIFCSPHIGHO2_01_FULL_35_32]OHB02226.1 MAG: rod shape-determining protein [Candidatus Zambryskibacteria bacterium RIFCSPLOWO2_01_FULL_35_19]